MVFILFFSCCSVDSILIKSLGTESLSITDSNNPETAGYLVLKNCNKFNTNLSYDPSGGSAPTANYDVVMPYHQKYTSASGNKTLHYVTFTPGDDGQHLDRLHIQAVNWYGTIEYIKLYEITKMKLI